MANLNSFSDSAEKVIKNAGKIARELGSNEVGTEHILYGITSVKECSSAKLLMEYGITEESMETVLEENADSIQIFGTDIEFTPRVKDLFRLAQNIAMQLGHNFIGTEHLLYALLSSSGSFAYRLLFAYFRVNINELKSKVLNLLQGENTASQASGIDAGSTGMKSTLPEKLLSMGKKINIKAREGKIDPIIGKEKEIELII